MSRHGDVTLVWGDGERTFRLGIGQIRELQDKTDCGPLELLRRIQAGRWRIDDLRQTLRLGLIGGGAPPTEAEVLCRRYFDERPFAENSMVPVLVLGAALFEPEDEELPKADGEAETAAGPSPTENSPSPPSTDGALSSASRRRRSTSSRSGSSVQSSPDGKPPTAAKRRSSRRHPTSSTP